MQVRRLMIAVAVLAALSAVLWWSNKNPEDATKMAPGTSKPVNLVSLLNADLVDVSVQRKDEPALRVRKNPASGKWEMVSDPPLATNSQEAMDLVTSAVTVKSEKLVDENATDLIQYGLEPAQITLELKDKAGRTEKLFIGDKTPVGDMYYARRPNEKKVYAIGNSYKTGFDRTVNDLRDKRLVILDESKLSGIELVRTSETLQFGKNSRGLWQLIKPQPFRTDAVVVDELFNKVKEANFDPALSIEDQKKNAAAFASAPVLATLNLTDGAGTRQLEVRKSKDNLLLAKSSTVPGIFKVADDLGASLGKSLDDYRSKKLIDFGFEDPTRIEIKSGDKTSLIERKSADWMLNGKKVDSASLMPFLDALRAFAAMKFVPGGFTTPAVQVTITQKDGKTIEKLLIAKVGNFHYAKREGESGEYEVDPKTIADLEAALKAVKEADAAKK